VIILLSISLLGCSQELRDGELPLSQGPFQPAVPAGLRTIEQRADQLVLPASARNGRDDIAVLIKANVSWRRVAGALRAAATGEESGILIFVRDQQGSRRVIRLPAISRFTEPILDSPTIEQVKDEHVVEVVHESSGGPSIRHLGRPVNGSEVASLLMTIFQGAGPLFFPTMEKPAAQDFPVWIRTGPNVTLQDFVATVSLIQSAGFTTVLVELS
jgi:hypothetical protein